MNGKRFLHKLRLRGLLSYGDNAPEIELLPLNVLIGPNASGKSNLIEAISLLQAAPTGLARRLNEGGGVREWMWRKGGVGHSAVIDTIALCKQEPGWLRYTLHFAWDGHSDVVIKLESVTGRETTDEEAQVFYQSRGGNAELKVAHPHGYPLDPAILRKAILEPRKVHTSKSVFEQFRDESGYPEITYLGRAFASTRVFRNWVFDRRHPVRVGQLPDADATFLDEDAGNLALVLRGIAEKDEAIFDSILEKLKVIAPNVEELYVRQPAVDELVQNGGLVQVAVREHGAGHVPASRLSDGTIRYLCLLTILCHPDPPPLVCIEEPELGLHPDAISQLARLLVEASQRMQIIVTTHSDVLVSALSEIPEAIVVCEHDGESTQLRRLDSEKLSWWLEKYSLGEIWTMGELGGNP